MSLEFIDVLATLIRASLPKESTLTPSLDSMNLQASLAASLYPDITLVGCNLFLMSSLALFEIIIY